MTLKRSTGAMLLIALCLVLPGWISVAAQEASTPADGECAVTTVEENVALVQQLYAAIVSADAETIDAILADDYTHNVNRYGLPDDPTSNADEIQLVMMMQQFYPNSTEVVRDAFGAGNKVVVESTRTITEHNFSGTPTPLAAPFEFRTIAIITIECGEIVSMNAMANTLELMVALGVVTLPEIAPPTPAA